MPAQAAPTQYGNLQSQHTRPAVPSRGAGQDGRGRQYLQEYNDAEIRDAPDAVPAVVVTTAKQSAREAATGGASWTSTFAEVKITRKLRATSQFYSLPVNDTSPLKSTLNFNITRPKL